MRKVKNVCFPTDLHTPHHVLRAITPVLLRKEPAVSLPYPTYRCIVTRLFVKGQNMFVSASHCFLGKSGMACGDGYCYETSPATFFVSSTVTTTNSNGDTITTTVTEATVITPGPGPGPGTSDSSQPLSTIAMIFPSSLPKLDSVDVDNSQGSGGLTTAQVGGVVTGVVVILIAIFAASFFIIRRLKKTAKIVAVAESKRDTSSGQNRSHKTSLQPTVTEVNDFDVDPLTQSPGFRPSHVRSESDSSFTERSTNHTPNMPSTSSTPPVWSGQYHAAPPISEAPSDGRHYSMDSSRGAYDVSRFSQQTAQTHQRVSYDSQVSHSRNHSNASELSDLAVDGPAKLELESNPAVDQEAAASRRRASTSAAVRSPPPSSSPHVRRGSGGAARGRSESAAAALYLSTVNEFSELHGYYGPPDHAVGETADRLGREASTASSTASRDLMEKAARLRRGDSSVSATPTEAYRKNSGPS